MRDRKAPSAPESEQGLLGCLIRWPKPTGTLCRAAHITPEHFYEAGHQVLYDFISASLDENDEVDLIDLTQKLRDAKSLEKVRGNIRGEHMNGAAYLTELHGFCPSEHLAVRYIETIREKHILRTAIKFGEGQSARCYASQDEIESIVADSQRHAATLHELFTRQRVTKKTNAQVIDEIIADFRAGHVERMFGRSIGIQGIDDAIGGLMPTDLLLIAGGPSSGKSALALQIEDHWSRTYGERVLDFTYEMTQRQKLHRLLQLRSQVNFRKALGRQRELGDDTDDRIDRATAEAKRVHIEFIDRESCLPDLAAIKAEARAHHAQSPVGLVVLDYDELIRGTREKGQTKEEELASIAYGWKGLAGELNCPAILLSQVTESDKGGIKMRGSSAKAQAGNSAIYIGETDSEERRIIKIWKTRDGGGRGQEIRMGFRGPTTTFYEINQDETSPPPNTKKNAPRR